MTIGDWAFAIFFTVVPLAFLVFFTAMVHDFTWPRHYWWWLLGHRKLARYTTWNPEPTPPYVGETRRTERGRLFLVTHMRPAWLSQSETELWGKYQEPQWVNRDLRDVANHQGFKPPKPPKQEIDAVEEELRRLGA